MLFVVWCAILLALVSAGLTGLSVRNEYLVLISWPNQGWFVLERRGEDGKYKMIPYWGIPVALARYGAISSRAALASAGRWISATALARRLHPLGIKV